MENTAQTYNIYGGRKKLNYDNCTIARETEKAVLLQTCSSEGSYLNDYNISFWLPKSVFFGNLVNQGSFGNVVTLPHYFDMEVKKQKIQAIA